MKDRIYFLFSFLLVTTGIILLIKHKQTHPIPSTHFSSLDNQVQSDSICVFDYSQIATGRVVYKNLQDTSTTLPESNPNSLVERWVINADRSIFLLRSPSSDAFLLGKKLCEVTPWKEKEKGGSIKNNLTICIIGIYEYVLKDTFVAINFIDLSINTSYPLTQIIFGKVRGSTWTDIQYLSSSYPATPACFDDFDMDGTMDFAGVDIGNEEDTLILSSLKNNRFQRKQERFIILERLEPAVWRFKGIGNNWR